ncbi:MAG: peptidase S1 [Actinobacteria bacterium HGW-Actinobacteria-4]|nr:MAG: peptidase S1 [Actinobacteria bacterium HGW-Actinobacteria-4]
MNDSRVPPFEQLPWPSRPDLDGTPHAPAPPTFAGPGTAAPRPPAGPGYGRVRRSTVAGIAFVALLVGAAGGVGASLAVDSLQDTPVAQLPGAAAADIARPEGSVAQVAAQVLPSVVSIEATNNGVRTSTGSGFVIREDGYILTNAHVIESSDGSVLVLLSDGRVVDGDVVGSTSDYDLAVVKIDETGLTPLVLGDSDAMVVGDPVIAIGSPLGLDATVTTGIVSSLHRPVTAGGGSAAPAFIDAIQTDAAINPGNSGGPLLNAAGEVIGVNSAVAALPGAAVTGSAGSVGLGFAIPSNQARRTAEELIETGTATFPVIGVNLDRRNQGRGVTILQDDEVSGVVGVVPGGPGALAGLRPGDVILAIDGRTVARADELVVAVRSKAPGDEVVLTILAGRDTRDVTIVLVSNTEVNFGEEVPPPAEGD